jgi:hypothetical protein
MSRWDHETTDDIQEKLGLKDELPASLVEQRVMKHIDNVEKLINEKHVHHKTCLLTLEKVNEACHFNDFEKVKAIMKEFEETAL